MAGRLDPPHDRVRLTIDERRAIIHIERQFWREAGGDGAAGTPEPELGWVALEPARTGLGRVLHSVTRALAATLRTAFVRLLAAIVAPSVAVGLAVGLVSGLAAGVGTAVVTLITASLVVLTYSCCRIDRPAPPGSWPRRRS